MPFVCISATGPQGTTCFNELATVALRGDRVARIRVSVADPGTSLTPFPVWLGPDYFWKPSWELILEFLDVFEPESRV